MSRDNDVTMVLALNRFSACSGVYFEILHINFKTRLYYTIIPPVSFHKILGDLTKNFGRDDFGVAFRFVADVINPRLDSSVAQANFQAT